MMLTVPLLIGFCVLPSSPDLIQPGYKRVEQLVAIENPRDFDGWFVVAATLLGPIDVTVVEPGVPFPYSSKYGTRVYGLPVGTPVPEALVDGRPHGAAFDGFPSAHPPVTQPSEVAFYSPTNRALTTLRILRLDESGIGLKQVSTQTLDAHGRPVAWWRLWVLPLGALAVGLAALTWLVRQRRQRATG